ncbi:hypothetical protein BZG35_08295 [Brevundimonas sp. LM2]|uniref:DUF6491 family protein n=1 Tax=Brevundimonas sp. LM2 TaxID=1938605 RepID=UPI0009839623|nr:DUF6491 family protein [Brevundimonas sp. LM2]AQR61651.1 hypothetical protein BZG35_08295 [Brevundimonas sp. LM2]
MTRRLGLIVLLAAVGGCAPTGSVDTGASAGDARRCFNVSLVSGFSELEGSAVRVSAGARDYDLALSGPSCDDVAWAQVIAVESRPSGQLCVGDQPGIARVLFRASASRRVVRCAVTSVSEQAAAPAA